MTLDLQRKSIAYRLWHAMLCFDRGRLISCIEACRGVWQYAWHHRRHVILRVLRANIVGPATAPRLCKVGCVRLSPHSRLRRQCGVMQVVTALAVNITDNQMFTALGGRACTTAPRLLMVGCVRLSPHSRLRRQCGVMQVVTAPRLMSLEIKWLYIILRLVCRGVWQYARQVSRR